MPVFFEVLVVPEITLLNNETPAVP